MYDNDAEFINRQPKHNSTNTLYSDFQQHKGKTILGAVALLIAFYVVGLGTCNVWRNCHHETSYSAEQYNIHADTHGLSEIHYAQQNKQTNGYQNQVRQQDKWRQLHIEQRTANINKVGLKHGVKNASYNPRTHQLNVNFTTAHPTANQRKYAQKLCRYVNE